VAERAVLEALRTPGAAEVVMFGPGGAVTEGLASNFGVIIE
jgi:hypothetical protein